MSQVVFDSSMTRTIQERSCDLCYIRKTKCSRDLPCRTCSTSGAKCTYERRLGYRLKDREREKPARRAPKRHGAANTATFSSSPQPGSTSRPAAATQPDVSSDSSQATRDGGIEPPDRPDRSGLAGLELATLTSTTPWVLPFAVNVSAAAPGPASLLPSSGGGGLSNLFDSCSEPSALDNFNLFSSAQTPTFPLSVLSPSPVGPGSTPDLQSLVHIFIARLHPSMPFFTQSYLVNSVLRNRQSYDLPFAALLYAICALTLFQPLQEQDAPYFPNRTRDAEVLLAKASRLHSSHVDFGENPTLETVMTSVFLFACQFCRGNHNAAQVRLREAVSLAEILRLEQTDIEGGGDGEDVADDEKDRRLRTAICLTVIERIYAIQRDYPLHYPRTMGSRRTSRLHQMVMQAVPVADQSEKKAIEGLKKQLEQVDFIDNTFIRCWKNRCWDDGGGEHVEMDKILALLRKFSSVTDVDGDEEDAQSADILVTRNWMRNVLWNLGLRHGFVGEERQQVELRPVCALLIGWGTVQVCEGFKMSSLETHGVGLAEKLYDIASTVIEVARTYYPNAFKSPLLLQQVASPAGKTVGSNSFNQTPESGVPLRATSMPPATWSQNASSAVVSEYSILENPEDKIQELLNRFLTLFSLFRGGRHPFLKPYMHRLLELDRSSVSSYPHPPEVGMHIVTRS